MEMSPLEKPTVAQLLKNFPAFYGTRRFITVFTIAFHWSLLSHMDPVHITLSYFSKIHLQ
jgi:hypothetical protein